MKGILIIGVIIAVVVILLRVIFNTPLMREAFANSAPVIKTQTECPRGTTMYMYEGAAFCCSGKINADATRAKDSCRPLNRRDDKGTFCTLGPTKDGVRNCRGMQTELLDAEGKRTCPPNMPTFVQNGQQARCCPSGGANADRTDCLNSESCQVVADPNPFKDSNSCQYLKMRREDGDCPRNFNPFIFPGQKDMTGITIYGCTDGARGCYSTGIIKRLRELGYDVSGLPSCSAYA